MKYQYFSKWRKRWCDFITPPTANELEQLKLYQYRVRQVNA